MILRIVLHSNKLHCSCGFLSSLKNFEQSRHLHYLLGLTVNNFHRPNYNIHSVSNTNSCILYQFQSKCSYVVTQNEIDSLCDFILVENPQNYDSQRLEELKKTLVFLRSKGYSKNDIKEKFLDYLKSHDCSYFKLSTLADIDTDLVMLLPLLSLPVSVLKIVANKAINDKQYLKEFSNRILYLSHHLELEPYELVPVLVKHSSILTMKFQRLHRKMNILKNANINPKYIVKDLWIFNYTEGLLASRIQASLKAGVDLKPWMLRCSEKFFEAILLKQSETERILNGDNMQNYLARKLDCNVEYVHYMMERNKLLKKINVPKLEQICDFLFGKGYTPEEIRIFPRVFSSSVKTLDKRFSEFQNKRGSLPTLTQLCMSNNKATLWLKKL